ncbi:carboxymuconolactone decarboxylase family protein [Halosquirtibacter xylanolyticus]|uniref:carboxymuconolactone decarboxylase family protein n=1 Tax=Halosquirtibacter xylanolyticus TaxID=3374599 RepID=UPI00374920AB|nr:carboxymuconolactone decarboxylase family protein [Prolixibacteraceae bacterium]
MEKIYAPAFEALPKASQDMLEPLKKKMGRIPAIILTIATSPALLEAYFKMDAVGKQSKFTAKEQEYIKLSVAETNRCTYCIAAHSYIAKNVIRMTDEEILEARHCSSTDKKLGPLSCLAATAAKNGGHLDKDDVNVFFSLGYDLKDLMDFIGIILGMTVTNYVHNMTDIDIDFPIP